MGEEKLLVTGPLVLSGTTDVSLPVKGEVGGVGGLMGRVGHQWMSFFVERLEGMGFGIA